MAVPMIDDNFGALRKIAFTDAALHREHIRAALNPRASDFAGLCPPLRPAAVLVPVVERDDPTLLFTRRTEHMPTHAGQISFPGGRYHAEDASLTDTALREVEEEIGIARDRVEIAGFLDPHETLNSGFMILPVVGFLRADYTLALNEGEVAEAFEVPLSFLIDPKNHELKTVERFGAVRQFHAIHFNQHIIWGATAAMIVNLSERLRA